MLKLVIPKSQEHYDSEKNEFFTMDEHIIMLEHSLMSVAKWEAIWEKPFLSKEPKTNQQTIDYIKCMTLTQNVDERVYYCLTDKNIKDVSEYIEKSMTATWFSEDNNKPRNKEIITAEVIYYWMIANNIPFECQKWHLNRLLTLIRVCNTKNAAQTKKMSKSEIRSKNKELNALRRKRLHSKG